jgi:hypothetical protein
MKNLVEDLKGMGVEPALVQGYTNNSQDFTPVVLAVKQSGTDVMTTYMTIASDQAIFARQLRQLSRGYLRAEVLIALRRSAQVLPTFVSCYKLE